MSRSRAFAFLAAAAPIALSAQQDTLRTRRDSALRLTPVHVSGLSVLSAAGPSIGSYPARVNIITRNALDAAKPQSLPEAMAAQAGVSLYDDLGARSKVTMTMRGFAASPVVGMPQGVSLFLDGIPVNEPDAGQVNFDVLPFDDAAAVEVLRGTASLLGPHSLAGAVNIVTRRPAAMAPEAELSFGSFGRRQLRLSDGGARASTGYYTGLTLGEERGWRQRTDAQHVRSIVTLERRATGGTARLQTHAASSRAATAGSLPSSVYDMRPDSNLTAGDFEDMNQLHIALTGDRLMWHGQASAALYFRANDAERFNVNQLADPDVRSFSSNRILGVQSSWGTQRSLRGATVGVRAGVGGTTNRSTIRIFAERVDPGLTTDVGSPTTKLDVFSSVDLISGPLTVSTGARYDHIRVPFSNRISGRDTTSTFQRVSPRLGVGVQLGAATFYGSVGRSFRAPALIELACADPNEPCALPFALGDDPPLAPVVATTLEAGSSWQVRSVRWSASAYRTQVRDDIFLFPYDDASGPSGSTIDGFFANIGATRREGVELAGDVTVGRAAMFANYAWTRATFQVEDVELFSVRQETGGSNEIEKGDRLPLVPAHSVAIGAKVVASAGVAIAASTQYTGERFLRGDEANVTSPLPGFWVADASIEVVGRLWSFRLSSANLVNVNHATFGTFNINQASGTLERFLTPGARRSLDVSIVRAIRR